jgi:RraA family protein
MTTVEDGTEPAATAAGASKPVSGELHAGPGFRVRLNQREADLGLVAALARFETPAISDLMNRLYTVETQIRCLTAPSAPRVAGPACTVKVFPGDNLMVHKALDVARAGDVLVIDASSTGLNAVVGDVIATKARHRGIVGFVIDGLVRDIAGIVELGDMPVFARGITPIGPLHRGPGEINFPVSVGGIVVQPGDVVIGDANGVVVVPYESGEDVLNRLQQQRRSEAEYLVAVRDGTFSNAWVDKVLAERGLSSIGALDREA